MPPKFSVEGLLSAPCPRVPPSRPYSPPIDVATWDVESVSGWLKLMKLDDVVETFRGKNVTRHIPHMLADNDINGVVLLDLDDELLEEMELEVPKRKQILTVDWKIYHIAYFRLLTSLRGTNTLSPTKTVHITARTTTMMMKRRMRRRPPRLPQARP